MGDKRRKRGREDSPSSEEEEPAKKAKASRRDSGSKKERKEKKAKRAKKEEDKRLLKEAKKFLKQKLKGGAGEGLPPQQGDATPLPKGQAVDTLSADDYFSKNAEFSTWLRESRSIMFNDLTTEQAKELFGDFVRQWNKRKLPARYYNGEGMDGAAMRRSTHAWGIAGGARGAPPQGLAAALEDDRARFATQRAQEKVAQKVHRAEQREALDDLLGPRPDPGTREARLEKKAVQRDRQKEASPDLMPLPGGGDPYGGGDSFAAAQARQARGDAFRARKQEARASEMTYRLQAAQAKEEATMDAFRAMLPGGGGFTIPKRA